MRFRVAIVLTTAMSIYLTRGAVFAHHSFSGEFDNSIAVTVHGVVASVEMVNPHSFIYVDVSDDKGNVATWKLEGYPPNVLYRNGWQKDATMKPGDKITVTG